MPQGCCIWALCRLTSLAASIICAISHPHQEGGEERRAAQQSLSSGRRCIRMWPNRPGLCIEIFCIKNNSKHLRFGLRWTILESEVLSMIMYWNNKGDSQLGNWAHCHSPVEKAFWTFNLPVRFESWHWVKETLCNNHWISYYLACCSSFWFLRALKIRGSFMIIFCSLSSFHPLTPWSKAPCCLFTKICQQEKMVT